MIERWILYLYFGKKVDKVNKNCMLILKVFSKDNTVKKQKLFVCIETNCDNIQKVPNRVSMLVNEVQVQTAKRPSRKKCKINKIHYIHISVYCHESTPV